MKKFFEKLRLIEVEWNLFIPSIIWVLLAFVPVVRINKYLLPQQPTEAGVVMNLLFLAGFMVCFILSMLPTAGISVALIIVFQSDIGWKEKTKTIGIWITSWLPWLVMYLLMHAFFN